MTSINWDAYEPIEDDVKPARNKQLVQATEVEQVPNESSINWDSYEPIEDEELEEDENYPDGMPKRPEKKFFELLGIEKSQKQIKREKEEAKLPYKEQLRREARRGRDFPNSVISGATAGYSQMIPGLDISEENALTESGKIAGSLLPIGAIQKAVGIPIQAAAKASPYASKALGHLGNILGLGIAGGVYEGLEESAEKSLEQKEFVAPSAETILEQGAKWAALDAVLNGLGWTGRFAKALYKKSAQLEKPVMQVLDDTLSKSGSVDKVTEKALSILEDKPVATIEAELKLAEEAKANIAKAEQEAIVTPEQRAADLKSRKISKVEFNKLDESVSQNAKPYLPAEFEATKIAEEAIESDVNNRIESISQRAASEKALGENIKISIEDNLKASKAETDALYDIAKTGEENSFPRLNKTVDSLVEEIKKLQKGNLQLTPKGYKEVQKNLLDTLEDLGYRAVIDESGNLASVVKVKDIPLSQSIEVKKRLNNIINYDLLETSAQDALKKPTAQLRQEIREGYGKNTKARKAFEEAEAQYAETASKKGKKSITKIRKSESPESISKIIKTPSGLADIKQVVSEQQFAQIERELLEHIKSLPEEKASKFYREIRESLSSDSRSIAEELIESKAPNASPTRKEAQRAKINEMIYDDISKSTLTGERPEKVLNLWKTKDGQQLIKNSLEGNPNKQEILKYLSDQSFEDFTRSFIDEAGVIDFNKFNKLIKDPATATNIRMIAGEEGYNFLKNMQVLSEHVSKNSSILDRSISKSTAAERKKINNEISKRGEERFQQKKQNRKDLAAQEKAASEAAEKNALTYKIDDLIRSYGPTTKGFLAALGVWGFGPLSTGSAFISYELMKYLAKNKNVQNAVKKAAGPWKNPVYFIRSLDLLDSELEKASLKSE